MIGLNDIRRQQLAELLGPYLFGKMQVGLHDARAQLQHLAPQHAGLIDGRETGHILRRAGFERDYTPAGGEGLYRRKPQ